MKTSPRPFGLEAPRRECWKHGSTDICATCDCGRRVLTTTEGRALLAKPKKKRHKYGVAPVEQRTVDGIVFDSAAEVKRYSELKLLQRGKFIHKLELQPRYPIQVNGKHVCTYIGDFRYFEGGLRVLEDVKGVQTPEFKLKKKLVEALYDVKIRIVPA